MEFFREVPIKVTEEWIYSKFTLANLSDFSNEIFVLEQQAENEAQIGGLWGEFTLQRSLVKGGVRFALKECPNALCWTLTTGYPPNREAIILHLTINRIQIAAEFTEEINEFLADQKQCIEANYHSLENRLATSV